MKRTLRFGVLGSLFLTVRLPRKMRKDFMKKMFLLLSAWILLAAPALAQTGGAIRGRVLDPQGAAVPGATLTVTGEQLQGERSVTSDSDGNYVLLGLPPGQYRLEGGQSGFKTFANSGIELRAGQ